MKKIKLMALAATSLAITSPAALAAPVPALEGVDFSSPQGELFIMPYFPVTGGNEALAMVNYQGAMQFFGQADEVTPRDGQGGIEFQGTPVRVVLCSNTKTSGSFEVWNASAYSGTVAGSALFTVNGAAGTSAFKGVNLTVGKEGTTGGNLTVEGTLTVGGKNVPTISGTGVGLALGTGAANATSAVAINGGTANTAYSFAGGLSGSATGMGSFSFGQGSQSTANGAISMGSFAVASGLHSFAATANATASGQYSSALTGGVAQGGYSVALGYGQAYGDRSFAAGFQTRAATLASVALGCANAYPASASPSGWIDTDPMFTVGNGKSDVDRSTGMEMLKNGQTTLRNRFWNATTPLAAVTTTGANDGKALVVEGNTELKGRVVISQPQGDISMGIYAP